MNIFIFANCQGAAIARLLGLAGYSSISVQHNYTYINHTKLDESTHDLLKWCDIFIYQPLSDKYPIYNTDNLKSLLKPECITISFPYIYNDAFVPLYLTPKRDLPVNGEYSLDSDRDNVLMGNKEVIIKLKEAGNNLEQILDLYSSNQINFEYEKRFNKTINILRDREQHTDIKIADFIVNNHKKHKLFNYLLSTSLDNLESFCNHPSNIILVECTNQILNKLDKPPITYNGGELISSYNTVSRYDINHYGFEWIKEESHSADEFYKKVIIYIYSRV